MNMSANGLYYSSSSQLKESEKLEKYQDLAGELNKLLSMKATVIPIIDHLETGIETKGEIEI